MPVSAGDSPSILTSDVTANDSDKTFTVPAGEEWEVTAILVDITTTATAGNRIIAVELDDGTTVYAVIPSPFAPTASLVTKISFIAGGVLSAANQITGTSNKRFTIGCLPPDLQLPAGHRIRVRDIDAIDAAADDMSVIIVGVSRSK